MRADRRPRRKGVPRSRPIRIPRRIWRHSLRTRRILDDKQPGRPERFGLLRHGQTCGTSSSSGSATGTFTSIRRRAGPATCSLATSDQRSSPRSRALHNARLERLRRFRGRYDPGRQPHCQRRRAFRLPAGQESPLGGSGQSRLSRSSSRPCNTPAIRAIPLPGASSSREWGPLTLWVTIARPPARLLLPVRQSAGQHDGPHDQCLSRTSRSSTTVERRERERPRRAGRDRPPRRPVRLEQRRPRQSGLLHADQSDLDEPQDADDRRIHRRRRAADLLRPFRLPRIHLPHLPQPRVFSP